MAGVSKSPSETNGTTGGSKVTGVEVGFSRVTVGVISGVSRRDSGFTPHAARILVAKEEKISFKNSRRGSLIIRKLYQRTGSGGRTAPFVCIIVRK